MTPSNAPPRADATSAPVERQVALALERLLVLLLQYRPQEARNHGLSNQQVIIMAVIFDCPGCSVKSIREQTGMFQSTISRSLESLVAQGHVERKRSLEDSRVVQLHLSSAGTTILANIRKEWHSRVSYMLTDLDAPGTETLLSGLELLLQVSRKLMDDPEEAEIL